VTLFGPSTSAFQQRSRAAAPVLLSAPVTVTAHENGLPHIRATVAKMAALARSSAQTYPIRNLATRIVHDVPSKQVAGELAALYRWVRDTIRYRFDPDGIEWLQRPERTVQERAGDCDDIATLLASLVGSLGHKWRFVTVGPSANVQKHVAVEALDSNTGQWVTLDPVLEPAQATTAPRTDLGEFGRRAPGAARIWDDGGNMLGSPTNARDRTLWDWTPYYPPVGVGARYSGMQPAQPGAYPEVADTYRSSFGPGFRNGQLLPVPAPIDSPNMNGLGRLGADQTMRDFLNHMPFGRDGITAGFRANALKGWNAGTTFTPKAMSPANTGAPFKPREKFKNFDSFWAWMLTQRVHPTGGGVFSNAANALKHLPGALAQTAKIVAPLAANFVVPGSGVALAALSAGVSAAHALAPAAALARQAVATAKTAVATAESLTKPHPALRAKYAKNARQVYDQASRVFRIYVPKKPGSLSGMGAFRPTVSFALGASQASPAAARATTAPLAQHAVNAAANYASAHGGKPPYHVHSPAVLKFQQADDQLSDDGEWGPNVRRAAAWYLNVPESSLPAFAPQYANYPLTWKAPVAEPRIAPKPVARKPAAPRKAAPKPKPRALITGPITIPSQYTTTTPSGGKVVHVTAPDGGPIVITPSPLPGYTEVGHEKSNPGFAPVPAVPGMKPAAPPAPVHVAVPPAAARSAGGAAAKKKPAAKPKAATKKKVAAHAAAAHHAAMAKAHAKAAVHAASAADTMPDLGPPPIPAGSSYADYFPPSEGAAPSGGARDNTLLWLAIGYTYLRGRRRAA
jgi:hypothetical protein